MTADDKQRGHYMRSAEQCHSGAAGKAQPECIHLMSIQWPMYLQAFDNGRSDFVERPQPDHCI